MIVYLEKIKANVEVPDDFTDNELRELSNTDFQKQELDEKAKEHGEIREAPNFYEKSIKGVLDIVKPISKISPVMEKAVDVTEEVFKDPRGRAFVGNAVEGATFGAFDVKEFDREEEQHPGYAMAGTVAGEVGSLLITSGALQATKLPDIATKAGFAGMKYSEKALRFIPRAIMTGATFGTKSFINESIKQFEQGELDIQKLGEAVIIDTALGSTLGIIGGISNVPASVASAGALGFTASKLNGGDNTEALLSGSVWMAFELIGGKGRNERLNRESLEFLARSMGKYTNVRNPKVSEAEATGMARQFIMQQAEKYGGIDAVVKDKGFGLQLVESLNQRLLKSQMPKDIRKIAVKEFGKEAVKKAVKPKTIDVSRVQELENSIREGEMILESGKNSIGKKMTKEELLSVEKSITTAKAKIETEMPSPMASISEPEAQDPLTQEALKYKTADEFVASYSLFHGTPAEIEGGKLKFGAGKQLKKGGYMGGHFFTDREQAAQAFQFGGQIYRASGDIKNKVFDVNKNKKMFKDFIGKEYKNQDGDMETFTQNHYDFMFPDGQNADWSTVYSDVVEQFAKKQGKIGFTIKEYAGGVDAITYQLFEDEIPIYTTQQLTDIYNKAHEASKEGKVSASAGAKERMLTEDKLKPKLKPLMTDKQKERIEKKKSKKKKALEIESAQGAKKAIHRMIRDRRVELNLKNYETNYMINELDQITSKEQREVIPFIIEGTPVPKELNRHDLESIYETESENLKPLADQVKQHFNESWKYIQENMDNISAQGIEDYVTHIWDIPQGKKNEVTNWFITKNRFLKQRYIETLAQGIKEFGLKPKYLDISDIIRIHDSVTNKTIANINFVKNIKKLEKDGIKLILPMHEAPPEWVFFDHPALRHSLVIPSDPKFGEKVSPELMDILTEMGVAIGRRISPIAFGKPTQAEGLYYGSKSPKIRLQRFFRNATVAHEIGHHLDVSLKLGRDFLNRHKDELFALNRERIEKHKGRVGKFGEEYARSTEEQIAEFFAFLFTDSKKALKIAPTASAEVMGIMAQDGVLTKLLDFDFEKNAKMLLQEQLSTMIKIPIKAHPDIANALKVVFDSRFNHPAIHIYEMMNGVFKKTMLSLSFFHPVALGEAGIATMNPTKVADIFFNPMKIYKAVAKGQYAVYEKQEIAVDAISHGLQIGATADIPVAKIQEALNTFARITQNIPLINKSTKFLASFNEIWDKALWSYTHDTLKLMAYEHYVSKLDPNKSIRKQKEELAQLVNDTFGGQNWESLLVSPKTLQIATWGLLSADWTISTIRQALAPTGFGTIHEEMKGTRQKAGTMFWIKAAIYFGAGVNLLNMFYRKKDKEENPNLYPDEFSFKDHTLWGNTIGHKTHLFVGRNNDGTERYIRWGKQFREMPEFLFDETGFSPITATLKKLGGKTAPNLQNASVLLTGVTPSGYKVRSLADTRGWERVWETAKHLIKTPLPMSVRSLLEENKEFHLTDLAMPSSRGMSRSKAITYMKIAIERKDDSLFREVYWSALRNNLSPIDVYKSSLSILKAENTKEINSHIKTINDVDEMLTEQDLSPLDKRALLRKKGRLIKQQKQIEKGKGLLDRMILVFEKESQKLSDIK